MLRVSAVAILGIVLPSCLVNALCVNVATSTSCPEWTAGAGSVVLIDNAAANFVRNASSVIDGPTFDAWIASRTGDIWSALQCDALVAMGVANGVTSYQYAQSVACQAAFATTPTCAGATNAAAMPRLCQSTCTTFLNSIVVGGFNTGLCTGNDTRNEWLTAGMSTCNALNNSSTCLPATSVEQVNCGTGSGAAATTHALSLCSSTPVPSCCVNVTGSANHVSGSPLTTIPTNSDHIDRLPLIAGLCGGFFFGFIALFFALIKHIEESPDSGHTSKANDHLEFADRATSIHAHRAETGARASEMWPGQDQEAGVAGGAFGAGAGAGAAGRWNDGGYGNGNGNGSRPAADVDNRLSDHSTGSTLHVGPGSSSYVDLPPTSNMNPVGRNPSRHSMRSASYATTERPSTTAPFSRAVVNEGYVGAEDDEVTLRTGDVVHVKQVFDDGWAWGINTTSGQEGAFPVVCLNHL